MESKGDIALIGLAVMGQNLILNMYDRGYTLVAYNRTVSKVDDLLNPDILPSSPAPANYFSPSISITSTQDQPWPATPPFTLGVETGSEF